MARIKIDYGIDLGTTNSAICRIENGETKIIKTDTLKDTMPSCVSFTKKKSIKVGDGAKNDLISAHRRATKTWSKDTNNTYIEFKRTMGLDIQYSSSFMERAYSSEELSAEVLKNLKSFVQDEDVKSVVITVPAKFFVNQKDATMRAAKMAGFEHVELLQEPIAASMAYGLTSDQKNGYWLVFDFGGGTFDAALLKVEDGIMQVFDTEGDNYLGGKNLDYAIVDSILVPYVKENFEVSAIMANENKRTILREALKDYAEEAKIQLSFSDKYDLITNLGELGEDDNGEEFELDLTLTREMIAPCLAPYFLKAINHCKDLLTRQNLTGEQLSSVILVGGPTYTPLLRKMIRENISDRVNTSIDPMTAVATGAALYASTIDNNVKQAIETGTIAFKLKYESTSVETMEYVSVQLDREASTRSIPEKLYIELVRGDKAWSSGRSLLKAKGSLFECLLIEGKANSFSISAFDEMGTQVPCFPNELSIIQGSKIGSAILPYNIGIEVYDDEKKKSCFSSIKGLERNQALPAVGVLNTLKTSSNLRPANPNDKMVIPLYQADEGAEGKRAANYEHVYTAVINGDMVPSFLPKDSDVELTVRVDRSEGITIEVYIPSLDYTTSIPVPTDTVQADVSEDYLRSEISKARTDLNKLAKEGTDTASLVEALNGVNSDLEHGNQRKEVLQHLKEILRRIDTIDSDSEWPRLEKKLRGAYKMLEEDNKKYGDTDSAKIIEQIHNQVDACIHSQDVKMGEDLLDTMHQLNFKLAELEYYIAWIVNWQRNFTTIAWKDVTRARSLVNQGMAIINDAPSASKLSPIAWELLDLSPEGDLPAGASGLLRKK